MDQNKKPGLLRRFFRRLGQLLTGLRILLSNLLFLAVIVIIIGLFSSAELPSIPDQGALVLNPQGSIVEQRSFNDPFIRFMGRSDPEQHEILLQDVIDSIKLAADDQRINTLVLELDGMVHGGISKLQEVNLAVEQFRSRGKKVIAVADSYTQDQYWLAAQADEVYLHPMGAILLQGYSVYRNYFKQALDKLAIDFHVFRVGQFKSAVEPFIRDDMSAEAKTANLAWLNRLWGEYTSAVTARRKLPADGIDQFINTMDQQLAAAGGSTARAALAAGLVDGIQSREASNQYLAELVGGVDEDGLYKGIGFESYLWLRQRELGVQTQSENVVGVIVAEGNIVDGVQPPGMIGGDSLAQQIRSARTDSQIKAVVLRINSGGGSAFASEIIRSELELLRRAGKPLVVSMSSVAASGGYWIASLADEIWAMPTTLTGSIGIFGAFPTLDKSLAKLGVTTDGVGTTELAGGLRLDRPLHPVAASVIQSSIEYGYQQFLQIVADGRSMDINEVAKIASGRVWAGSQAKELGLVDQLGGLDQAVASAARLAGLDDFDEQVLELPLTPAEQILRTLSGVMAKAQAGWILQVNSLVNPLLSQLGNYSWLNDPRGVYLYCQICTAP